VARTDRTKRIAASIADAAGLPGATETLATLPASALGSLLLAVHRSRAGAVRASQLLAAAGERLFRPSTVDGRMFHRFDAVAFEAARAFDALDVAPVAPFGACAALAGIDQNNVLTALRRAEVLADSTVALALAAATRRRPPVARADVVRLCTSARLVRMQSLEDAPAEFTPHFRLFALVTAGRDAGEHRFETGALAEHVLAWLRLADGLRRAGFSVKGTRVEVSDMAAVEALCLAQGVSVEAIRAVAAAHRIGAGAEVLARVGATLPGSLRDPRSELGPLHRRLPTEAALRLDRVRERVVPAIATAFPATEVRFDLSRLEGLGYYRGLAFRISVEGPAGSLPVVDGGVVPWMQALLADRKERLVASAIGTEAVCKVCPPEPKLGR
jgi:hypothetical protein